MGLGNIQEPPQGIKSKLPRRVTADSTLLADDLIVECDSAVPINFFLPPLQDFLSTKIYYIKNYGLGMVTVASVNTPTETIDNGADYEVLQNGSIAISANYNNSNWIVVSDRL